jgi:hypothetical protein
VGDTHQEADRQEVNEMRAENEQLLVLAESPLNTRNLKESLPGKGTKGTNDAKK